MRDGGSVVRLYLLNEIGVAFKGYIQIEKVDDLDNYVADIGIAKTQRTNIDLKNKRIGLSLFESLLEYVAGQANFLNKDVKAEIEWNEDYPFPNQGMKLDKWQEIFEPILIKRGFKKSASGEWFRIFHARN